MASMVVNSVLLGLGVVAVVREIAMIILDGVGSIVRVVMASPHSLSCVFVPSFSTIFPDLAQLRQRR